MRTKTALIVLLILATVLVSASAINLRPSHAGNLGWLMDLTFPPDTSALSVAWQGIKETMHIAYLGTLGGFLFALPLALLGTRNLFPATIGIPVRMLLAALRVMPSILWAIIFVILVGLGPLAGVLALVFYTTGYLGKLLYEAFEGLPQETFYALESMGANRLQVMRFAMIPEAANAILSQLIFMFEYNVRHSSIIGIVGAGGIGFYLSSYLKFFEYGKVLTLLIVIFGLVVAIDALSAMVRSRYIDANTGWKMRWRQRARSIGQTISTLIQP